MSTSGEPSGFADRSKSIGGAKASKNEQREVTFNPTEKQEQFLFDTSDQILMSGTVGAGKSRVGCEKGYILNTKYPGNRGLIVRKAFFDVRSSTINQTLLEDVIPEGHIVDHNKGEHVIEHVAEPNGPGGDPVTSEIHYHGLDSGRNSSDKLPKKIMSHEFGWIFVDEGTELTKDEWTGLLTRLRYDGKQQNGYYFPVPKQQIFTATNPAPPTHWMYDLFIRDNGEPGTSMYQMSLHDNPGASVSYRKRMETQLSGIHYERLVEGKWVGAEGMVYGEYDPGEHLIHPRDLPGDWTLRRESRWGATGEPCYWVEPPENWEIFRAIDFGYTNPFVCQWWARSPDDTLVLFREKYESGKRYEDHASEILEMDPDGRRIRKTVADHDAEGQDTLNNEGVNTVDAEKSVIDGIQAVKKRLAFDDRGRADLYFMEGARVHRPDSDRLMEEETLKTTDEISGYVWAEDADGNEEEEPVKEEDHGMDAMRYLVYTLDGGINISSSEIKEYEQLAEGF
jgi:phage terminase large subunit